MGRPSYGGPLVLGRYSGSSGERRFLTTGAPGPQNGMVEAFWGAPLRFEAA